MRQDHVLITGAGGFIGRYLVNLLVEKGLNVIALDDNSNSDFQIPAHPCVKSIYESTATADLRRITDGYKLVAIFHLGEYSRIHPSFQDYNRVLESNITGTQKVLELWKNRKCPLIYAGSSTRFCNNNQNDSPYAFTKYVNCEQIKNMAKWFDLNYSISYFNNVYGPLSEGKMPGYQSVIDVFHKQYLEGKPLTVCSPGTQRRDFTSVWDTVDGIYKAFLKKNNAEYNLRTGKTYSILEVAAMFGSEIEIKESRLGDRLDVPDHDFFAQKELDWQPKYSLEDYITRLKNESIYQ